MKTIIIMRVEWLGHASIKLIMNGKIVYIDPYQVEGVKADFILITHDHYDHCDPNSVNALKKPETKIVTTKLASEKISGDITVVEEGDTVDLGFKVTAVPAYNKTKNFHPRGLGVGFVIDGEKRVYHAGDTDLIPEMGQLEGVDLAFLPVGGTYTMDVKEAIEAVKLIRPKAVFPIHYGSIGLTANIDVFAKAVEELGVNVYTEKSFEL